MASNPRSPPRRRSMTDAFFLNRNSDAAHTTRTDIINMVEEMRQRNSQLDAFANSLPKLTESDLAALDQSDSTCPICLTSLLAIIAEQETAVAMDSPAHPIEELGVTRLVNTCGHIFCRKDIRGWLYQGHTTCPTCRTPVIAQPEGDAPAGSGAAPRLGFVSGFAPAIDTLDAFLQAEFVERAFEAFLRDDRGNGDDRARPNGQSPGEELLETHFEYNHDRDEFSGMYS